VFRGEKEGKDPSLQPEGRINNTTGGDREASERKHYFPKGETTIRVRGDYLGPRKGGAVPGGEDAGLGGGAKALVWHEGGYKNLLVSGTELATLEGEKGEKLMRLFRGVWGGGPAGSRLPRPSGES